MFSLVRITRNMLGKYAQILLVLTAFALMVVSSYSFVSERERGHLKKNAEDAILYTEANIKSDMLEPETLLGSVCETIRAIIFHDRSTELISEYFSYLNEYVLSDRDRMIGIVGFYGIFDVYGGQFFTRSGSWIMPDTFDPTTRPWYTAAVEANGKVAVTQPYMDLNRMESSITFSRQIFGLNGSPLAIICLDINLEKIRQHAVDTRFAEDGYGFLLSENMEIIAHPEPSMLGMTLYEVKSGIAAFKDELLQNGNVSEAVATNYRGAKSIVFIQRLQNGWYMGIVTPRYNYFHSTRTLAVILSALGTLFAFLLIWLLVSISMQKASSEERMQIMFNTNPFCTTYWDKNLNVIDCNQNALELFGLSGKHEFIQSFFDLSPECQPDGKLSKEKGLGYVQKALAEGYCRFEWMHQKSNGEPIPCEVTLIRVKYENDFIIVGYTRDLREQKKMLKEIQQRARLLDTVNSAAAVLLSSNNVESFEASLLKSFDLVGHCLDIDRVQIWRNEVLDDGLYFVLRHEWLSDFGKNCRPVPYGLRFPYSKKPKWKKKFLRGENINAPLRELPEEDQSFLGYYQMKSIVIIPMFLDGNFWGFFSIDDCRLERTFSDEEISILTSAGLMMTSAVNRNIQAVKMREAEERTQIMIDTAPLCAIFWDKNLKLIDCNQEAVKLFELSDKQEFIDKFTNLSPEYQSDGISSGEKGARLVREALEKGYSRFEWTHQKLNGEPIPAEVTCVRVKHRDEFTVTEYIRDLREQKAMIAEMRKAEIAEESSKAKSDFLAKMSHEIRTPMNAILGIAEIQLQDRTTPQAVKDAFERIHNSGDLLLGIINDILDLSKIEAGKLKLIPAQYDISGLIYDTVQLNIMRYKGKPIEFVLNVSKDIPKLLFGDELRIKQVLNNVLSNAFKYTQEGQIIMKVSAVQENARSSKVTLVFSISDTGQGMTTEQVRKLGTEYSRFNMEANRKTEGAGLGMNITRNLVHLMKGSISIESTPGMGSTFTVSLPQKRAGSSVIGKEMAENLMLLNNDNTSRIRTGHIKREFMPYGRVLVVDDVETNLYVAKGLMTPYGLSIDTAMSGFEAVDKIRDGNSYDIVFMDHMMPRMDGIEAAKIIRSLGYTRPIVALTANALAGQAEMFLKNGFDDFISKPIDSRQLNMSLNKLIRDKQPPDVVEAARQQKKDDEGEQSSQDSQMAEVFVRDAKKAIDVLESILRNKLRRNDDVSMLVVSVHAMKSALVNIGENELSEIAAKLEQGGRDKDIKLVLSELPQFVKRLRAVIDRFEPQEKTVAVAEDEADNSYLKEKLLGVKAACAAYNKKAAKSALSEIKRKKWPQSVKKELDNTARYLLHGEFDEAVKAIGEYVRRL